MEAETIMSLDTFINIPKGYTIKDKISNAKCYACKGEVYSKTNYDAVCPSCHVKCSNCEHWTHPNKMYSIKDFDGIELCPICMNYLILDISTELYYEKLPNRRIKSAIAEFMAFKGGVKNR